MGTVVAEGVVGGRAWRLEAWRPAQDRHRVFFAVRRPGREGGGFEAVSLDHQPLTARISPDPDDATSVLFCAVADEVQAVVVEPLRPVRGALQRPAIGCPEGLGRFVVVAFEEPVEVVRVQGEPRERFASPETFAVNTSFGRRRDDDGDEPTAAHEPRRPRPGAGGARQFAVQDIVEGRDDVTRARRP